MKQNKNSDLLAGVSRRDAIRRGLLGMGGLMLADKLLFRAVAAGRPVRSDYPQLPEPFPAGLRRASPVQDLNQAIIFTVNALTTSEYAVDLARCAGSDLLIRGWFKWGNAPPVQRWRWIPQRIHQMGARFGGGITCSALIEGENGLTPAQLLDMATRGPDGQPVNAWGHPNIRHGSLSSPAYLDYLFRWCREQIDAGVDCLFMDENTAALEPNEGYDDYSLNDFRAFLLHQFSTAQRWTPNDSRWQTRLSIELANPQICPGGDMRTFRYRAYLRARGLVAQPLARNNPLAPAWRQFRLWRDDRAWKSLTDRIRAYATAQNRHVFINANGLARYVDLQVLGVWKRWLVKDGEVDLRQSQLRVWRELVVQGQALAAKRVPVVFFHDWGFGHPHFPWMAVSPAQRKIWMRIRGPEIYAAGGFFAFPVLGPHGCDAARDGTLETITQQTRFYQTHRRLYTEGEFLGDQTVHAAPNISLAVWTTGQPREVAIHVINREAHAGQIVQRSNVAVTLPVTVRPKSALAVSPDWSGEHPVAYAPTEGGLKVTLKELEAYAVVRLQFGGEVDLAPLKNPPPEPEVKS